MKTCSWIPPLLCKVHNRSSQIPKALLIQQWPTGGRAESVLVKHMSTPPGQQQWHLKTALLLVSLESSHLCDSL